MYLKNLYKFFGKQVNISVKFDEVNNKYFFLVISGILGKLEKKYLIKNYLLLLQKNVNELNNVTIISLILRKDLYKSFLKDFEKIILGVTIGWGTSLDITGRGFNFKIEERNNNKYLRIKIGYSHFVYYKIPSNILIKLSKKKTKLLIYGLDYWIVWKLALQLRSLRSLHTYKVQGISFSNEKIILKPGKQKQI